MCKIIIGVIGGIGCLSGDTIININRAGKGSQTTIENLHNNHSGFKKNYTKNWDSNIITKVRSFNGKNIQLHDIIETKFSGFKDVYMLKLSDGKTIKATKEHMIMTDKGFVQMRNLTFSHKIMIDTLKPKKGNKKSYKMVDTKIYGGYHPFLQDKSTIPVHILTYEAHINNLSFIDFLDIIWNDKETALKLKFIDRNKFCLHHKNGNHYDNSIDNLELLENNIHLKLHSIESESFLNFNQGIPEFVEISKLPYSYGIEKTYDIACKEPYHNFVANGIIVHNSGKTLTMTYYLYKDFLAKRQIYSNYGLKFKHTKLTRKFFENYAKSGLELMNSSIGMDELHVFLDSRSAMSVKNKMMTKFITQSRKRGVDLYYTTQDISHEAFAKSGQVDIRLRKLTDMLIHCNYKKVGDKHYVINDIIFNGRRKKRLIDATHIIDKYNTYEIVDFDDD